MITIRNVISTDLNRLGLVEWANPKGTRKGGVEYRITQLGKDQDALKIPSLQKGVQEVRRRQGKAMPKGVTDPGQVIKSKDGGFAKLEGEIDMVALAEAFVDYITHLKDKVQKLGNKISLVEEDRKKIVDALKHDLRRKDKEIVEQKQIIEKLHELKEAKGRSFNLGELAQFRSSKNKA